MESKPYLTGRAAYVYRSILRFAGGKRYVMRAPIRLWFELDWDDKHADTVDYQTKSQLSKKRIKFQNTLASLEMQGYIRRIGPGCIEVLENI